MRADDFLDAPTLSADSFLDEPSKPTRPQVSHWDASATPDAPDIYQTLGKLFSPTSVMEGMDGAQGAIPTAKEVATTDAMIANPQSIARSLPNAPEKVGILNKGLRGGIGNIGKSGAGILQAGAEALDLDAIASIAAGAGKRARDFSDGVVLDKTPIAGFTPNSLVQDMPAAGAGAISSVLSNIPSLAANVVLPGSGLPLMGLQSTAGEFSDARAQGIAGLPAFLRAVPMGIAEVAGEKAGGFNAVSRGIRQAIDEGSVVPLARAMVKSGLKETPGEELTTAMQFGIDKLPGLGMNQDATLQDYLKAAKDTALTTMLQSGGMVGGGMALSSIANKVAPPAQQILPVDTVTAQQPISEPVAATPSADDVINGWEQDAPVVAPVEQPAKQVEPTASSQPAEVAPDTQAESAPASNTLFDSIKAIGGVNSDQLTKGWGMTPEQVAALPEGVAKPGGIALKDAQQQLGVADLADSFDTEMRRLNYPTQQEAPQVAQAVEQPVIAQEKAPETPAIESQPQQPLAQESAKQELPVPAMIGQSAKQLETALPGFKPSDIVNAKGKQFATKSEAQKVKKEAGSDWRVAKAGGGFVVRHQPQSAKQVANNKRMAQEMRVVDVGRDSMMTAIAKLGGVNAVSLADEIGYGPQDVKGLRAPGTLLRVVTAKGMNFDSLAESLAELGYLSYDENGRHDTKELADLLEGELSGTPHYTPQGYEQKAQQEYDAYEQEIKASGIDSLADESHDSIEELLNDYPRVESEENAEIEAALDLAITNWASVAQEAPDAADGAAQVGNRSSDQTAGSTPQERSTAERPADFALRSESLDEGRARTEAQDRQRAEQDRNNQQADQRAKADSERDTFTLTGSNRAADVAEANGQNSLFDPSRELTDEERADIPFSRRKKSSQSTADAIKSAIAADPVNSIVEVYQSISELPTNYRDFLESRNAYDVEGFYDPKTKRVILIADNLSPERAVEVARHEVIGHYGIENMLGKDEMSLVAGRVIKAEKDGNKVIADLAKQVDLSQPGLTPEKRAKEIIAVMAERNIQNNITKRVLDAIRKFLHKLGIIKSDVTDADIAKMLRAAREYMEDKGRPMVAGEAAPVLFQRAFHGSPHRFDKFSLDAIGSGEGAQAYGHGLYFAGKKEIAEFYRDTLKNPVEVDGKKPDVMRMGFAKSAIVSMFQNRLIAKASEDRAREQTAEWAKQHQQIKSDMTHDQIDDYVASLSEGKGQLYEVEIPDDHEYLLWDKPLSEQPDVVQKAIAKIDLDSIVATLKERGDLGDYTKAEIQQLTGEDLYDMLRQFNNDDQQAASMALHNAGVAGVKYLDGTSRPAGDGSYNYVVFDDSRISVEKTYYSRQGAFNLATFEVPDPGVGDNIIRAMQNNKIDLKRVQDAIRDNGRSISEGADAYLNEELYIGRVTDLIDKLVERRVTPLLEAVDAAGFTLAEVNDYLYARHAPERNAQLKKINAGPDNEALSGMSDAKASGIMAQYAGNAEMERIASMADNITAETRRRIVSTGLETADMVQAWEGAYKHYVPLMRDGSSGIKRGSGFNVRGKESKRSMGGTSEATNILANIIAQAQGTIIRSEKAKVSRSLLDLARQHPNDAFWKVDEAPQKKQVNKETGLVEWAGDPLYKNRDNVLVVKENGIERFIVFNEKNERAMEIAKAMQNLDAAQLPWAVNAAGKLTRSLAMWITSRNPLFWITNFARDVQHAAFNLADTPISGKEGTVLKNIPSAMKGYWQITRGNGAGTWATYAEEFKAAGAETGFVKTYDTPDDHMADLEKQLKEMQQGKADPRKLARSMVTAIDDYNNIVENGVRLAVYQTARDNGVSIRKAASLAKNITVNFNRRGTQSSAFNALYMFMNANIQGHARFFTAVATSKKAQAVAGSLIGVGFVLDMVGRAIGGDDDKTGRKKYDLIPDFEKERNWIFMAPSGQYIKIPMPQGLHVMPNMGRLISEAIFSSKKVDPVEKALSLSRIALDAFNPFGSTGSFSQLIAPTIVKPIVQTTENKSFTGSPLYREGDDRHYVGPAYERHFRNTADHWVGASKLLNDVSGGDDVKPGMLSVPPEVLRTLFLSYVAPGITQTADKAIDTSAKVSQGKKVEASQIPALSRFYGEAPEERSQERAYYEEVSKVRQTIEQAKQYAKKGNREGVDEAFSKLGDGDAKEGRRVMARFEQSEKQLVDLNKIRKKIESNDQVDPERKRAMLERNDGLRKTAMLSVMANR